jgi:hypothetical protein
MQSACNIIGLVQWQYSQEKAAFGYVGRHASHQAITACCDRYINAFLPPAWSLCRQMSQVSNRDRVNNL